MNRILGSMRRIDERRGAVRVEDVYDTNIDDLWAAVTEPKRLARWIAAVEGDLKVGGIVQTRFTSTWEGPGRIEVCDPPNHLVITMEPGTDDEAVIEAVLTSEGERTPARRRGTWPPTRRSLQAWRRLAITHRGSRSPPRWRRIELEGTLDRTHSCV